jgi:DNA repair exonuclease SbcCD ATPase subunit
MEWFEGRITKRSADASKAPETRDAITMRAYTGAHEVDPSCAHTKILELMYEIEALKRQHSGSYVESLQAELSVSYATNRGFKQQWKEEREDNEKLNAELKDVAEYNENINAEIKKLHAALKYEIEQNKQQNALVKHGMEQNQQLNDALKLRREENEKLNAALKFALLENDNLSELTRSLREQADGLDGLPATLEIITDQLEKGQCPLRLSEIIDWWFAECPPDLPVVVAGIRR